jgi:hypothetical protein
MSEQPSTTETTQPPRTLWLAMQDYNDPEPWAVAAFNAKVGMALWFPEARQWVDDPEYLAPFFLRGESGAKPIPAAEAEALLRKGVGPPGKPLRGVAVTDPDRLVGLPVS